MNNASY